MLPKSDIKEIRASNEFNFKIRDIFEKILLDKL
jgi:hypothetical protein